MCIPYIPCFSRLNIAAPRAYADLASTMCQESRPLRRILDIKVGIPPLLHSQCFPHCRHSPVLQRPNPLGSSLTYGCHEPKSVFLTLQCQS